MNCGMADNTDHITAEQNEYPNGRHIRRELKPKFLHSETMLSSDNMPEINIYTRKTKEEPKKSLNHPNQSLLH